MPDGAMFNCADYLTYLLAKAKIPLGQLRRDMDVIRVCELKFYLTPHRYNNQT